MTMRPWISHQIALSLLTACAVAITGCVDDDLDNDGPGDPDTSAIAAAVTVPTDPTTVVRQGSSKCLDVNAASSANGAKIQQYTCNGTAAQSFKLESVGSGTYRIRNVSSNKCLDITGNGTGNGTKIQQYSCSSNANQKFKVEDVSDGFARLRNPATSKCVDVSASSNNDGAQVQLWTCNGTGAQSWKFGGGATPPPPPGQEWRRANLTNFTSYPAPGSEECEDFNGCTWAGYFAFVTGKMSETWVMQHNIAAVHSRDANQFKLKTLRLKQGSRQLDVTVYDMCADSDCDGCCTQNANAGGIGFLIDIESYTMERFGSGDGVVEWTCLDCQ